MPPQQLPPTGDVELLRLRPPYESHQRVADTQSSKAPSTTPSNSTSRSNFYIRIISFVLLEAGFLILAYRCLVKPIPLHQVSSETSLAYAGKIVTVISIGWHALATFLIKDIVSRVFSAESMEQYHISGVLQPGETDKVSRITSGQITHAKYFFSQSPTLQYRLAYPVVVLIMILGPLGAAVISATATLFGSSVDIRLANLPFAGNLSIFDVNQTQAIDRANIITRLEHLENNTYGYQSLQEGILIPWPQFNQGENASIIYESDIITYNTTCEWKDVTPNNTTLLVAFEDGEKLEWGVRKAREIPGSIAVMEYGSAVTELILSDPSSPTSPRGALLAFLFSGNTSVPPPDPLDQQIYLGGLPTFDMSNVFLGYDPIGATFSNIFNGSVLLCDPKPEIVRGKVVLSQNTLEAKPLRGAPLVGNIDIVAANIIFSRSLLDATLPLFHGTGTDNPISLLLFFGPPGEIASNSNGLKPLPPDQISRNMNNFLRSSSKAYLNGWKIDNIFFSLDDFQTMSQNATILASQPALVSSKPFLISLFVVVVIITFILIVLVTISRPEEYHLLDLGIIEKLSSGLHMQSFKLREGGN